MLYDCFLFFDELELLEVRLHELIDVVDRVVLVESTVTHSGLPKPLYYAEAQSRFHAFADRIIHVVVEDMPTSDDAVAREGHQRNAIVRGLESARPDDVVLLSDADEIPRVNAVHTALAVPGITVFHQDFFYYWINCRNAEPWRGTRMASVAETRERTPEKLRYAEGTLIEHGGWHFSYLGQVEGIQRKLRSFSHTELNTPRFTDPHHIAEALRTGRDLFNRDENQFEFVAIDDSYPRYILDHLDQFRDWIGPASTGEDDRGRLVRR